jgi:hypothetical protein
MAGSLNKVMLIGNLGGVLAGRGSCRAQEPNTHT